ncbi:UDP-2,4-diacetamido-2,4,6-trideoxy-beta-L-altropyranose hydrolase [Alteromonas sp. W364]|uniref:UDP-2,4-diacetamido-2,4, 6-trideoxy-beta-L-altropyranose hydrolase n=1 Tax=Alteromonas sp. W364 TaxID=3075610 RepID=UPI00288892AB|nr:UDP-2,4-diacetamido-2,4,6-trideoxy-beta-L-altropyranose hydrolase [Alteromonas sp. W364]MDT0628235.1 UDP-2,4-diacetamido-2,4,6-trideoxy-beta-L-altropyranose hydrolase [Alteromonas sp. W364]
MQLIFRVEGNQQAGLGHLMRCFALAQAAQEAQIEFTFVCTESTQRFLQSRHQWQGNTALIPNGASIDDEINIIQGLFAAKQGKDTINNKPVFLVLDGYQFDYDYQKKLKSADLPFAYFDDINTFLANGQQHLANIIINGAPSATELGYEQNASTSLLLLGDAYQALRLEFLDLAPIPISERHSMLVSFGGADAQNHSLHLLAALSALRVEIPVRVVTGAAYANTGELDACIRQGRIESHDQAFDISMPVQHVHDAQDMADMMLHSKLAVCAAGGSQFELLHCYTPSFLLVVADNQYPATQKASQQGWCEAVDWRKEPVTWDDYLALATQLSLAFDQDKALEKSQQMAIEQMQGRQAQGFGIHNILDACIAQAKFVANEQ